MTTLAATVERVLGLYRSTIEISPAWVATTVMTLIDFPRGLHHLGYAGCHLELRQIARSKLRRRFDPTAIADDDAEPDLFPETLQHRYPLRRKNGEEPRYRLLNELTDADVRFNVSRMRKAGHALLQHAARLDAWNECCRGHKP